MVVKPTFDALAQDYDTQFSQSIIAPWLRDVVHARLESHFPAGSRVLELGCGTGEDALRLAQRGVQVVATDASAEMLAITARKTTNTPQISVAALDLQHLPTQPPPPLESAFDGAFANFGPLNCLNDWKPLAAWLAQRVRPGSIVAFGMMSRFCLWEVAWHGLHGDLRTAKRRLSGRATFAAGGDCAVITYPTPSQLARDFAPWFERVSVQPLGLLLPPSDSYGVVERWPRLLRMLLTGERIVGNVPAFAQFADHYWITFQRTLQLAP
jgi:SAM-dependent methyltransferase